MHLLRVLSRLTLTLLAVVLVVVAVAVSALRLGLLQQPTVQTAIVDWIGIPADIDGHLQALDVALSGFDPSLQLGGLTVTTRSASGASRPLLSLDHLSARLDGSASLRAGYPVFSRLDGKELTLHFYQTEDGQWRWTGGSEDSEGGADLDIDAIDRWMKQLARQNVQIANVEIVLHGQQQTLSVHAPSLLIAMHHGRPHLEGRVRVGASEDDGAWIVAELPKAGDAFDARLQLHADAGQAAALAQVLVSGTDYHIDQAQGETTLWATWHEGELNDVRGVLDVSRLALAHHGQAASVNDLSAKALFTRKEGRWHGWISDLRARLDGQPQSALPTNVELEGDDEFQHLDIRAEGFDIGPALAWQQLLPLPDDIHRTLSGIKPEGHATGVELRRGEDGWHTTGGVEGLSSSAWQDVPGGGPVNAWVEMNGLSGQARFASADETMRFALPRVFDMPWTLERASGVIGWQIDKDDDVTLTGKKLTMIRRGASASGSFELSLPHGGNEKRFKIDLDIANVEAEHPRDWLPLKVLKPELRQWLEKNIHGGDIPRGSLALNLIFDDEEDAPDRDRVNLALDIRNANIGYMEGWPALTGVDGSFKLHDDTIDAHISHANLVGLVTRGADISLKDQRLDVTSDLISGDAGAALRLLQQAPLSESLSKTLNSWRAEGAVNASAHIIVPMETPDQAEIMIDSRIGKGKVLFLEPDITVSDIGGTLDYHHLPNDEHLNGTLKGQLFDGPLKAEINLSQQEMNVSGRAQAQGIAGWLGIEGLTKSINGEAPYQARFNLKQDGFALALTSPLTGVSIDLPAPFGKRAEEAAPLTLNMDFVKGTGELSVKNRVYSRWRDEMRQGQIWLEQWPDQPQWPEFDQGANRWQVIWHTPRLDPLPWQEPIKALSFKQREPAGDGERQSKNIKITEVDFQTPCLVVLNTCLGRLTALGRARDDGWHVTLGSALGAGEADWLPARKRPLSVRFDTLDLEPLMKLIPAQPTEEAAPSGLLGAIETQPKGGRGAAVSAAVPFPAGLASLPDGSLDIAALKRGERTLGELHTQWRSNARRLILSPLRLVLPGATLTGKTTWERAGDQASLTRAQLQLDAKDIGDTLKAFDQPVVLRTQSGRLDTQLAWPGAPWQFALERANGNLSLDVGKGRFVRLESAPAKLIGLLNFDNLVRRLTFDFSDVTKTGTAFNAIKGSATLYDGRLLTQSPVEINGTATNFTLNGQVDLIDRTLNQRLSITVPVSQNLPLAAVLIGAPQVGGALFVLHWLFGHWLDEVTELHYRVRGPWASPQISLENAR